MKVLVVDDMSANRKLLVWMLEDEGHEVIEAENGKQAFDSFVQESPNLVLMDVMMPVMDGYESAKLIKQHTGDVHVPVIFLTALNDEESLSRCLASGGDDFLTKPFNEHILQAKISAHTRIQDLNQQITEKNQELLFHHLQTNREHEIVEHVFSNAINASFWDSGNIEYYMSAMSAFNGDLLLSAPSPSGGLYVLLGDFTGHGLSAAIGSLPVSRAFFAMSKQGLTIGDIAEEVNSQLVQLLPDHMFCAATLLELNSSGDEITLWAGGLPDGLLVSCEGEIKGMIVSQHMPLGALETREFERDVKVLRVSKGDRIFLHTDGIIESNNGNGEMFCTERFEGMFKKNCFSEGVSFVDKVIGRLEEFTGGGNQDDDISLVELLCQPVTGVTCVRDENATLLEDAIPWTININLGPDQMRVGDPISRVVEMMGAAVGLAEHKDYVHTVLTEMYANSLDHGILGLDSALKKTEQGYQDYYQQRSVRIAELKSGTIEINLEFKPAKGGGDVFLKVKDSGKGFEFDNLVEVDEEDSFGRGLPLIYSLCEDVKYSDGGCTINARYNLRA
ncbi:MAG: fused response regulator/phosphatase [Gammaproteobacteria bacterium]|nr:MAG: fused response regulator/phosphatase [Gammaproteobacteria bacterium]